MTLEQAMKAAELRSKQYRCVTHVCATVKLVIIDGTEKAVIPFNEFSIDDWFDGTVLCSYTNGVRQ